MFVISDMAKIVWQKPYILGCYLRRYQYLDYMASDSSMPDE
jgi:hypothetical protein